MTYANIKLKTHRMPLYDAMGNQSGHEEVESKIHPFMSEFIEKLALKYPQWTFEEVDHRYSWDGNKCRYPEADRFKVFEKREELGFLGMDVYGRQGKKFVVENFRVAQARSRGHGFKTIHQDKAIKHVAKYFGRKDYTEVMDDAENRASACIASIEYEFGAKERRSWQALNAFVQMFITQPENWEKFSLYVEKEAPNSIVNTLHAYPQVSIDSSMATRMRNAHGAGTAWLINIVDSLYIVKNEEGVSTYSSEELPNIVRRNLGMLKLVQDGHLIDGVGIRIDDSTFSVYGDAA